MEKGDGASAVSFFFPIPLHKGMHQEWVIYNAVPILDSFDDYTEEDLAKIVENSNRRASDTGDLCPISLGHTKADSLQKNQPEIVGFVSNFKVSAIGEVDPRPCIVADLCFYADKHQTLDIERNFPRRSAEVWRPDYFIDPVAVLSSTTPARDLGLLGDYTKTLTSSIPQKFVERFSKKYNKKSTYDMENQMEQFSKESLFKEFFSLWQNSAPGAWVEQHMKDDCKDDKKDDKKPDKHSADEDDDNDRLQKDEYLKHVAKYAKEAETYKSQIEALQRDARRAQRERDLLRLEQNENIVFDLKEELDFVQNLPDDQYNQHTKRMVSRYAKSPVGVAVPVYNGGTLQRDSLSSDAISKALEESLMRPEKERGTAYRDALKKLGGEI